MNESRKGIIFIGAPGSGKGTQAKQLKDDLGLAHISTGDLLRAAVKAKTPLGLEAKGYMDSGGLVPDGLVIGLLQEALRSPEATKGFVLDGFPRTLVQAKSLDEVVRCEHVVELHVPFDLIEERITGRRMSPSGHVYHVRSKPPVKPGICDVTGEALYQRDDDTVEKVRARLEKFVSETKPVLEHYASMGLVVRVDGVGDPAEVYLRVRAAIEA